MAKIKNVTGLTDKVKSDLISSLEKMLSSEMINGLNTAKYKIGDIISYEKKKGMKRLNINMVEPNGDRVLSIYTGEKFTENKVSDSKSKFRDNQVYSGVLKSLFIFFRDTIREKNIKLMIPEIKLIEKSLVNLERLQELCVKPTRVSKINKWTKKELLEKLSGKCSWWSHSGIGKVNDEVMSKIIELRNQILKECFDLSVFNYIPEQKKIQSNIVEVELDYYNHYAILPELEDSKWRGSFRTHASTDMLTEDIIEDVLNRYPANSNAENRFEDIYIPRERGKFFGADYLNIFLSKIEVCKDKEYIVVFNVQKDLEKELYEKSIEIEPITTHSLVKLYFGKNLEIFKEVKLYGDIVKGIYKHSSLRTEKDRLGFIEAIDKKYPYLKKCRESGDMDILLNTAIYIKIRNYIYSANELANKLHIPKSLLGSLLN